MLSLIEVDDEFDFFNPYPYSTSEAWQQWREYSCVEWNGNHIWMVELYHPEDESGVFLYCDYCLAGLDVICLDGIDLLYGQLGSINIEAGEHDSDDPRLPFSLPVTVTLEKEKHFNPLDMIYPEYDVSIILCPRS